MRNKGENNGDYQILCAVGSGDPFEYWIGKFTPVGTAMPESDGFVDFQ